MLPKLIPLWRRYKFPFLLTKPPHFSDMGGTCPHISKFLESTLSKNKEHKMMGGKKETHIRRRNAADVVTSCVEGPKGNNVYA